MLSLIEKQQVRKRFVRFHAETNRSLSPTVAHARSVAGQRWLARREPLLAQLENSTRQIEPRVEPEAQPRVSRRAVSRSLSRISSIPVLSVIIALIVAAAIGSSIVATKSETVRLPKGGLSLPPDNAISGALTEYSQSARDVRPNVAVTIPNPKILEALKTTTYTLRPGDTISGIAAREHISVGTLISFNGITDVRRLTPGMQLKIPSMNGTLYRVRSGDTLGGIAKAEGVKLSNILDANRIASSVIVPGQELFLPGAHMNSFAYRKALGTLFLWPTVGVITSPFGMRRDPFSGIMEFHNGIDIANDLGTPVKAAMDGTVALVARNRGYGNFIILNNGNGFQTLYGHLSKSLVQKGQYVRAGSEIGLMGDTGYATGPHLHFTIYKDSAPVNPLAYLPKR